MKGKKLFWSTGEVERILLIQWVLHLHGTVTPLFVSLDA